MIPVDRNSNPFATCWTSPQQVPYVPLPQASPEALVELLEAYGWWGQIIGRHGAGKSTLLHAMREVVTDSGRQWQAFRYHSWQPYRSWLKLLRTPLHRDTLLVVDGYEQLSSAFRKLVEWRCRRHGCGLLVTAHAPIGLPTLLEVAAPEQIIEQVFRLLVAGTDSPVDESDFRDAFNACNGDIRQLFSNLYDLHERRVRQAYQANQRPRLRVVTGEDAPLFD